MAYTLMQFPETAGMRLDARKRLDRGGETRQGQPSKQKQCGRAAHDELLEDSLATKELQHSADM